MNEPAYHLQSLVRTIPDFPKPGILFRDITTLLSNPAAFQETLQLLVSRYRDVELHAVCGIESRGFLIGAPLALELGVAFVPIRKPGKLPAAVERVEYALEYGTDSLEIHKDALQPGQRVLLADDLLATGGTISAAAQLVQRLDTIVHEAAFIIELEGLGGREKLSCPAFSLMRFTEERWLIRTVRSVIGKKRKSALKAGKKLGIGLVSRTVALIFCMRAMSATCRIQLHRLTN